ERRQKGQQAPDRAEVVDPDQLLDRLGSHVEKVPAPSDSRAVHEQADLRMPFAHRCSHPLDSLSVADVADFVLASDLVCRRLQAILPSPDQDAVPAPRGKPAGDRGPDPRRAAGDDGYRHTRTAREARVPPPRAATTTARSRWRPRRAARARQVTE